MIHLKIVSVKAFGCYSFASTELYTREEKYKARTKGIEVPSLSKHPSLSKALYEAEKFGKDLGIDKSLGQKKFELFIKDITDFTCLVLCESSTDDTVFTMLKFALWLFTLDDRVDKRKGGISSEQMISMTKNFLEIVKGHKETDLKSDSIDRTLQALKVILNKASSTYFEIDREPIKRFRLKFEDFVLFFLNFHAF